MNITDIKKEFCRIYGGTEEDIRIFRSPGRVNMIGEHTDYNGGYVFPAALKMATTIAARKRNDGIIRLKATDLDVMVEAEISRLNDYRDLDWGNYQLGVAYIMQESGYDICGCDLLYDDTVPHGGGLSSSAAIEVSTALMFATFNNEKKGISEPVDMIEMALLGQKTEHEYCGVNCGIMDQFASAMGKENHAILLDCDTLKYKLVPLDIKGCKIVLSHTKKKHKLGASKYNERRSECDAAVEALAKVIPQVKCLADVTPQLFESNKGIIENETVCRRAEHVVYEIDRVLKSVDALEKGDIETFGKLMNASHDSLRDLYEVTGFELDTMVEEARKIPGVLGSRMTGAGFGGCTVSIVKEEYVDEFIEKVGKSYAEKTGLTPEFYVSEAGNGGCEIL